MVDGINRSSGSSAADSPLTSAAGGNAQLDKGAFLKLLVAQISHQDPLKPMTDTAFVAQLAQFSALEQQMGTNKMLELVTVQQRGLANTSDVALVGKNVTVKGSTITNDGQGLAIPARFSLGSNADTVNVSIKDATGKVVRTMKLGAKQAGPVNISWDGKDDGGTAQPAGAYTVSVDAKGPGGSVVDVNQETTGLVTSVSFDKGYATLVLDNGVTAPTSELIRVNANR